MCGSASTVAGATFLITQKPTNVENQQTGAELGIIVRSHDITWSHDADILAGVGRLMLVLTQPSRMG